MIVKFIDDLLDGQLFLKNIYKLCKSKQFTSAECLPLVVEKTSTLKNNTNTKITDTEFVCKFCKIQLSNLNDFKAHLKIHYGN